jgi:hypothetical protein
MLYTMLCDFKKACQSLLVPDRHLRRQVMGRSEIHLTSREYLVTPEIKKGYQKGGNNHNGKWNSGEFYHEEDTNSCASRSGQK